MLNHRKLEQCLENARLEPQQGETSMDTVREILSNDELLRIEA